MATAVVEDQPVEALASCFDAKCLGYLQKPVQALKTITQSTYIEQGGDMNFVDRSHEYLRFADEQDRVCEHCGGPRFVTEQERPEYPDAGFRDRDGGTTGVPAEVAGVMVKQAEAIARLEAQQQAHDARRGPGRPRKTTPAEDDE